MRIYIAPSNQEHNIGVGNYGTEEERMNQLADKLIDGLHELKDVEVFRNTPSMTLQEEVADANNKNVDLYIAIHSNACNGNARGCTIFCYKYGRPGEDYAQAIYKHLSDLTPTNDRGVIEGYNYYQGQPMYEVSATRSPAVLIEVGFHDNVDDAEWILNNMTAIATAIKNGIVDVTGLQPKENEYKAKYENLIQEIKDLLIKYSEGGN